MKKILQKTNLTRYENIIHRLGKLVFVNEMDFPNPENQRYIHNTLCMLKNYMSRISDKDLDSIGKYTDIKEIKYWIEIVTYYSPESLMFFEFIVKRFCINFYFVYDRTLSNYKNICHEEECISRFSVKHLLGMQRKSKDYSIVKAFPSTNNIYINPDGTYLSYEYIKRNTDNVDECILAWKDKMSKDYVKSGIKSFSRAAKLCTLLGDTFMQYYLAGRISKVRALNVCKCITGLTLSIIYCIDVYGVFDCDKTVLDIDYNGSLSKLIDKLNSMCFRMELNDVDNFLFEFVNNTYKLNLRELFTLLASC